LLNPRILIIEDSMLMQTIISRFLKEEGFTNLTKSFSAEEALGHLNVVNFDIDIILLDIGLPKMDGVDALKLFKQIEKLKDIPVIMVTANESEAFLKETFKNGAHDYIVKPFTKVDLSARISAALRLKFETDQRKLREQELLNTMELLSKTKYELEKEIKTASLIQQKILPQNKSDLNGFQSSFLNISMDAVGGDFYDYQINEDEIDLFIADVSGHGLPAAFLATITKLAFSKIHNRSDIVEVLKDLNRTILEYTVMDYFVTTFFCIINIRNKTLRFANSGHETQYIYRKSTEEFIEMKSTSYPLGIVEKVKSIEQTIQLFSGDRLILYTDGITECNNPEFDLWSSENLKEFTKNNSQKSPAEFTKLLIRALRRFAKQEKFSDDVTLVVIDVP
jgi:serine phosphatase RsbU (regulator of sigma subunit)